MAWTPDERRFSEPGNDTAVMAAWERFLDGSGRPDDALRSLVEGSWQRCRDHNVDPDKRSAPPPVGESRLESLRNTHAELLQAGAPVMACARDFLAETGTVMALADTQCTILSMEGDTRTRGSAENIHLLPGVAWSERICGTNAIGTALAVGEPVQIHSAEHYCAGIKRWTCSAMVIRHPNDGEILGVVDVSGLSETYNRQSLALVVTTANRIESRLKMRETELRLRLVESALPYWNSTTDSVVLFDRRGYPVKANGNAQVALAALGADLDLARPRRIPALALDGDPSALPAWMRPEWLAPVIEHAEHIGTLLILPLPSIGRTPRSDRDEHDEPLPGFGHIVTGDAKLEAVIRKAGQLARSKVPVLLLGETGVGKEEFAQGIHRASPIGSGPFVPVNCGGLSRELLASELFGYAEGAFTGARRGGMVGKIEAADGGSLFLDEIGEMPLDLQPHLLRVLEKGEIYRLGENTPRKVDFRLVAATNRDLRQEVADGRFRMDLYYRDLDPHPGAARPRRRHPPADRSVPRPLLATAPGPVPAHRPGGSPEPRRLCLARQRARASQRGREHAPGQRRPTDRSPRPATRVRRRRIDVRYDRSHRPRGPSERGRVRMHPPGDRQQRRQPDRGRAPTGDRQEHAVPEAAGLRPAGRRPDSPLPARPSAALRRVRRPAAARAASCQPVRPDNQSRTASPVPKSQGLRSSGAISRYSASSSLSTISPRARTW